ncbi:hypothetical protein ACLMJK_004151 [Lecanora helva]
MPATRVTVASNTKQSQKAPLLIPSTASADPCVTPSCFSFVIKTAQTKLRLKRASRVFVHGGRELIKAQDWVDVLKDDATFLVSTGEEYVGSKKEEAFARSEQGGEDVTVEVDPKCPVELLADKTFVDPLSVTQLETVARTLPGMVHAVGQPDLHPGTKFPIGSVFVSKKWIHPPLIGGDIGCGMAWYKTSLSRVQIETDKGRKIADKLRGLEGAWRTQKARELWLDDEYDPSASAGVEWDASLGTIGAGNHFVEAQVVEEVTMANYLRDNPEPQCQLLEGEVILLVHSGSRGYGSHILKHFTKDGGRDSIYEDEPLAQQYLEAHDRACAWASRNRDLIALRFLACLEPGDQSWDLGINDTNSSEDVEARLIIKARHDVQARKVVDIYHNNLEHRDWPPSRQNVNPEGVQPDISPPIINDTGKAYIHRKGAAPTYNRVTNQPLTILPLPGSRATPTLILHPLFTSLNQNGHLNALSLAHGAGRALSRAKAATYVSQKYSSKAEDLLRGDFVRSDRHGNKRHEHETGRDVHGGCWVVCEMKDLVWEEAPEAYKDVWDVGDDLVKKGCAERWGWCRGRVSYKVRKE